MKTADRAPEDPKERRFLLASLRVGVGFALLARNQSSGSSLKTFKHPERRRLSAAERNPGRGKPARAFVIGAVALIWRNMDQSGEASQRRRRRNSHLITAARSVTHLKQSISLFLHWISFSFSFFSPPLSLFMSLLRSYSSITNEGSNDACRLPRSHTTASPSLLGV